MHFFHDHISINDLEVNCIIGILPDERLHPQPLLLSIQLGLDLRPAARTEDINQTVDYFSLSDEIKKIAIDGRYLLIETLAEAIAKHALNSSLVKDAFVTVKKPLAVPDAQYTSVSIQRKKADLLSEASSTDTIAVINISSESRVESSLANINNVVEIASKHKQNGAKWIEIGGRSTNPKANSSLISIEEEQQRLLEPLSLLLNEGFQVSVETWSIDTALKALELGAKMLNFTAKIAPDELLDRVHKYNAQIVLTYMPSVDPEHIQQASTEDWDAKHIIEYFLKLKARLRAWPGINVIADPNIGIFPTKIHDNEIKKIQIQLDTIRIIPRLKEMGFDTYLYSPKKSDEISRIILSQLIIDQGVRYIRTHTPIMIKQLLDMQSI